MEKRAGSIREYSITMGFFFNHVSFPNLSDRGLPTLNLSPFLFREFVKWRRKALESKPSHALGWTRLENDTRDLKKKGGWKDVKTERTRLYYITELLSVVRTVTEIL